MNPAEKAQIPQLAVSEDDSKFHLCFKHSRYPLRHKVPIQSCDPVWWEDCQRKNEQSLFWWEHAALRSLDLTRLHHWHSDGWTWLHVGVKTWWNRRLSSVRPEEQVFSHRFQDPIQQREILKEYAPREHIYIPSLNCVSYFVLYKKKKKYILFDFKQQ